MKKYTLRVIAVLMTLAILLTGSIGAFAEDVPMIELLPEQITELTSVGESPAEESKVTEEPVPEVAEEPAPEVTEEPAPEVTEEPAPEVTEEPVPEVTEEPAPEVTEEPAPEVTEEPAPEAEPIPLPQTAQELADHFGLELWEIAEAFELSEEALIALPAEEIAALYGLILEMLDGAATFAGEFEIDDKGMLTRYNGSSETVVIPSSVKMIGTSAFRNNTSIRYVTIPASVTAIVGGNNSYNTGAFQNCTNLRSVIIEGSSLKSIGVDTFCGCTKLSSINIPSSVETIGANAFTACSSLTDIALPGVETIDDYAFDACTELERVSLPNTLKSMGEAAFRKTALKEVTIPGSLKNVPLYAFSACAELEKVIIESGVESLQSGNTSYNTGAFQNCTNLRSVEIRGNTLRHIGVRAFCGCTKLSSINIPSSVETIDTYAFYGCTALTGIVLPSVESLGNYAFDACTELERVSLPNTLTFMGEAAFRKTALKEVTIPGSLKNIPLYAFSACAELEKVIIESGVESLQSGNTSYNTGAFQNCTALKEVIIKGNTLESIGTKTFCGCTDLQNVYLPASVETFGSNVFYSCKAATVWVYANSPAHTYCVNNAAAQGFNCKLYGSEPTPTPIPTATPTVIPTVTPTVTPAATPTITPTPVAPDAGILLIGSSELTVGKSMTLKAEDENGKSISARKLDWSSSDKSVATVSSSAKVTAKKAGVVTITAKNEDGLTASIIITVMPKASSVTIWHNGEAAGSTIGVDISESNAVQLETVVNPDDASQSVTWKSSSSKIATVDENGLVTILKSGKATITATAADGSKKSDTVTINAGIMVQQIEISGPEELASGKNITLKANVYPENASSKAVEWSTSDKSVATVSSSGKVTARKVKGVESVTITAAAKDGSGVIAEHELWIVPAATGVTITIDGEKAGSSAALDIGGGDPTLQLDAVVNPEDASQNVSWKSSSKIATVDENGLVTGLKKGKATITATATDGSKKSDKITINVICAAQEIEIIGAEELTAGKSTTLKAYVYPEEASQSVSWKSSDTSIASVDSKGKVTAKKISSAESVIITATAKDGSGVEAEHEIWVYPAATKVEILLDGESARSGFIRLSETDSLYLEAVVYPEEAFQTVSWKSSNTSIAEIDMDGRITAHKAGKATITATAANGKSSTFSLTVSL